MVNTNNNFTLLSVVLYVLYMLSREDCVCVCVHRELTRAVKTNLLCNNLGLILMVRLLPPVRISQGFPRYNNPTSYKIHS